MKLYIVSKQLTNLQFAFMWMNRIANVFIYEDFWKETTISISIKHRYKYKNFML